METFTKPIQNKAQAEDSQSLDKIKSLCGSQSHRETERTQDYESVWLCQM